MVTGAAAVVLGVVVATPAAPGVAAVAAAPGRVIVTPASISGTLSPGASTTKLLTVRNTGGTPAQVTVGERRDGNKKAVPATSWVRLPDLPEGRYGAAVAYGGGKLYVAAGRGEEGMEVKELLIYDTKKRTWTYGADSKYNRYGGVAKFFGGKLIVAGGIYTVPEAYDPVSDTWTDLAAMPTTVENPAVAKLGYKLYLIGGRAKTSKGWVHQKVVQVYDTVAGTWSTAAAPPHTLVDGCATLRAKIYCATATERGWARTDLYDPSTDSWTSLPKPPVSQSEAHVGGGNGGLIRTLGSTNSYHYSPSSNSWQPMPGPLFGEDQGTAVTSPDGFYIVGGHDFYWSEYDDEDIALKTVEFLKGWGVGADSVTTVDWMSRYPRTLTLAPGQSATVKVTLYAGTSSGTRKGAITFSTDTPYVVPEVPVTVRVN